MSIGRPAAAAPPSFDVYYGDVQNFGQLGNPQRWINVVGEVADPDGQGISSLSYTLNGGPAEALSIGPDSRRLYLPGEFNVEIDHADLLDGANLVSITAVDAGGESTVHNVTVFYTAGQSWSRDYLAQWNTVTDLTELAQPVDGLWSLEPAGLRTPTVGYDRTIVIGDLDWTDYEVTVPITIHAIDPNGYGWPSVAPGIGFTTRWLGHTWLNPPEQPHVFWEPAGGTLWYDYNVPDGRLFIAGDDFKTFDPASRVLTMDTTYVWKMRVHTEPDGTSVYSAKIWEQGQSEPPAWELSGTENAGDVHNGSLILVAHHVDATFGDVEVVAIEDAAAPPVISEVVATMQGDQALVSWVTNEPTTSQVDWGETASYGNVASDGGLVTRHWITLVGLDPNLTYHFQVSGTDADSLSASSPDQTFSQAPGVTSDDFSGTGIDSSVWTLVDPLGDATFAVTGTQATISVPDTADHGVWTNGNTLPRLQQAVADPQDFEVEVKFESDLVDSVQSQGILIEQSDSDLLRIEYHRNGNQIKLFAATILGGVGKIKVFDTVNYAAPMFLRVQREGDFFTIKHSDDGVAFTTATTFTAAMTVNAVSVFAGNSGVPHTAVIDYVFDVARPIDPEDGNVSPLSISLVGNGTVTRNPDKTDYLIGESVELTAVPGVDAAFTNWSGDLSGNNNPETIVIAGATNIVANFVDTADTTPPVVSAVSVDATDTDATITWSTNEPSDSQVDWGLDSGYGSVASDPTLTTGHSISIGGLTPGTLYHFEASSADAATNVGTSGDLSFVTDVPGGGSGFQSDDFSTGSLNLGLWSFVDPLADSTLTMTGTQAQITVPGTVHDVWVGDNSLPRIRQPIADGDFVVEAKFDTAELGTSRSQGILIEQNDVNVVRVEFHDLGSGPQLFAATIFGSSGSVEGSTGIPGGSGPMYLRVARTGDVFDVLYSLDGTSFANAMSFTQPMTATSISFYAGNWSGVSQTVLIDYAFDQANPIVPEDGGATALVINTNGMGSVIKTPDQPTYQEGDVVQLTAVPDADWAFSSWGGALSGSANPQNVTVSGVTQVDANFVATTGTFQSDDFSAPTLDTGIWTFINPIGDASVTMTGTQARIDISAANHVCWAGFNTFPRLQQAFPDEDFDVQVKFDTEGLDYGLAQGILIEQDNGNLIRFELNDNGEGYQILVANIFNSKGSIKQSILLPSAEPIILRATRSGNFFEFFYSIDGGATFVSAYSQTKTMTVNAISFAVGSWSGTPETVLIDYAFDTAFPIVPEDGNAAGLVVDTVGNGSVTLNPDKPLYENGDVVEITAVPAVDWALDSWSGAATGSSNPVSVTVSGITTVQANFIQVGDTQAPVISNVVITPTQTSATVTWTTNEAADSQVEYGVTSAYTDVTSDATLLTAHSITLMGLTPDTDYHVQVSSEDAALNLAVTVDLTFSTPPLGGPFRSDDFSSGTLDTGVWTFVDPLGDASVTMTGTQARIDAAASTHIAWAGVNTFPRLRQAFPNEDFEVDVKFETTGIHYGMAQGMLIEQGPGNLIRFELNDNGEGNQILVANIFNSKGSIKQSLPVSSAEPIILRTRRTGNLFEFFYSIDDGATFVSAYSQTKAMTVTAISFHIGTWSGTPESILIDYAFDTAYPIVPEDGNATGLVVQTDGNGSVTLNPDKPDYADGEQVEITAVPDVDWAFDSWSGAAAGNSNPTIVTISGVTVVQAHFSQVADTQPPVISDVAITPAINGAIVTWTTNELSDSQIDYGLTSTYTDVASDAALTTSHSITISGLTEDTQYHFEISSEDPALNLATSGDLTFTTLAPGGGGAFQSDDFSGATLDTGIWTFVDPLGDASVTMTGTQAQIDISGANHNTWIGTNTLPRLQQSFTDEDFEIDVRFETTGIDYGQSQGILIEQDDVNLIRFEVNDNGNGPQILIANIFGTVGSIKLTTLIPSAEPIVLRARRTGNTFDYSYSLDGTNFTPLYSQTKAMTVNAISIHAGNWSGTPETVLVDYAFDTAYPILP